MKEKAITMLLCKYWENVISLYCQSINFSDSVYKVMSMVFILF